MLLRFTVSCFLGLFTALASAETCDLPTFPSRLEGKWEQIENDEKGDIRIIITKKEGDAIYGLMTLTGSTHCKDPIPFRGESVENTASIFGDALIICGYRGKLTGVVTRVSSKVYRGNFSYKWFDITWAKGTFELAPAKD